MDEIGDVKKVGRITCTMISPEQWQWKGSGGFLWVYELWGRKLRWQNLIAAEGIKSLNVAVAFSHGFEAGWMERIRLTTLEERLKREGPSPSGSFFFDALDGKVGK